MKLSRLIQALFSLFFSAQEKEPAASSASGAIRKTAEKEKDTGKKSRTLSLQQLCGRYENELMNRQFHYTLQDQKGRKEKAVLVFDAGNFCHLFSIPSIADKKAPDPSAFSGMQGWRNIQSGKITLSSLQKMDPEDFNFYHQEFFMFDELLDTVRNPRAVRYDPARVPGSRLKADLLLYGQYQGKVVHLALSRDRDGTYFPRSFFIRQEKQDKAYPTKYIEPMEPLKVLRQMSIKKA